VTDDPIKFLRRMLDEDEQRNPSLGVMVCRHCGNGGPRHAYLIVPVNSGNSMLVRCTVTTILFPYLASSTLSSVNT
jgi:hypothetical protein